MEKQVTPEERAKELLENNTAWFDDSKSKRVIAAMLEMYREGQLAMAKEAFEAGKKVGREMWGISIFYYYESIEEWLRKSHPKLFDLWKAKNS